MIGYRRVGPLERSVVDEIVDPAQVRDGSFHQSVAVFLALDIPSDHDSFVSKLLLQDEPFLSHCRPPQRRRLLSLLSATEN